MKKNKNSLWTIFSSIMVAVLMVLSMMVPAVSASISPTTLEATLASGESINETKNVTMPELAPKADVIFALDLTGSMGGIINTAKANSITIMDNLTAAGVDVNFGAMSYMDYPHAYTSYGYNATYGWLPAGDYAYSLDQAITSNKSAVSTAINSLALGSGGDGPQDYTRIFYESYADSNVSWRSGAKKVLLNFGDNVPHDNNLREGVTIGNWSTGGDPGRDEIMFTADDLDLQIVLNDMATNNVILLEAHTSSSTYWDYWTNLTGGKRFTTGSTTLVDDVVTEVISALTSPTVTNVHLEASAGYESWISSGDSYTGPTGVSTTLGVTITVPEGTDCGDYEFTISAVDDSGVSYGTQKVIIHVPCEPEPEPGFMTGGGSVFMSDGTRVTHGFALNCDASMAQNNLQINWGKKNKFHLENLTTAACSDDPAINPKNPKASFDTYEGTGMGRYNGVSGATAHWIFTDAGEPGKLDIARILIKDAGNNTVLTVSGNLKNGNQQAHDE